MDTVSYAQAKAKMDAYNDGFREGTERVVKLIWRDMRDPTYPRELMLQKLADYLKQIGIVEDNDVRP